MQPHYESLHASMEALGALCALVMGLVLWQRARRDSGAQPLALAAGFLGMGVLEMFHAVSPPGNAFILLRHLASLVGGIGFACVWLPGRRDRPIQHAVPWLVAAGALVCGVAVMLARDTLPDMMR
ncbi:MAG TPA: hypothetical protein VFA38_10560, partial [Nitrospirales bacterium]|nr:hypothetical protein [Nitrospirales bacterium]